MTFNYTIRKSSNRKQNYKLLEKWNRLKSLNLNNKSRDYRRKQYNSKIDSKIMKIIEMLATHKF